MRISRILTITMLVSIIICCKGINNNVEENQDEKDFDKSGVQNMSIREIMEKYYADDNFYLGASAKMGYFNETSLTNSVVRRYISEINYNTPENDFKQAQVYKYPGDNWNNRGYMQQIEAARKYGMVIRAHGPISPQCSAWTKEDNRTPQELTDMLNYFMTEQSKDLEKNKDVVKWMDVVNETMTQSIQGQGIGYDGKQTGVRYEHTDWFGPRVGTNLWENPWPLIGFETLTYDNGEKSISVPKYIRMAFEVAEKHAPSIKKIYNVGGLVPEAWEIIKPTVLALRENGATIDGLGWQAHVSVGWETDPKNIQTLQNIINWCGENNLEFHITELDVSVTKYENTINYAALQASRNEQAATITTIIKIMLDNINNGACGVNHWVITDRFSGQTIASLFDESGNPNEAYFRVKELLYDFKNK